MATIKIPTCPNCGWEETTRHYGLYFCPRCIDQKMTPPAANQRLQEVVRPKREVTTPLLFTGDNFITNVGYTHMLAKDLITNEEYAICHKDLMTHLKKKGQEIVLGDYRVLSDQSLVERVWSLRNKHVVAEHHGVHKVVFWEDIFKHLRDTGGAEVANLRLIETKKGARPAWKAF